MLFVKAIAVSFLLIALPAGFAFSSPIYWEMKKKTKNKSAASPLLYLLCNRTSCFAPRGAESKGEGNGFFSRDREVPA